MARLTAQQIAAKWADKTAGATQAMKDGAMATEVNPAEAAIARKQQWIDGLNKAFRDGTWERALRRVTIEKWRNAYIAKGIPVIAERVRLARPKYQRFAEMWMNYLETVKSGLQAFPRGTLEQNIARSAYVIRQLAAARGRFRGGEREELAQLE